MQHGLHAPHFAAPECAGALSPCSVDADRMASAAPSVRIGWVIDNVMAFAVASVVGIAVDTSS